MLLIFYLLINRNSVTICFLEALILGCWVFFIFNLSPASYFLTFLKSIDYFSFIIISKIQALFWIYTAEKLFGLFCYVVQFKQNLLPCCFALLICIQNTVTWFLWPVILIVPKCEHLWVYYIIFQAVILPTHSTVCLAKRRVLPEDPNNHTAWPQKTNSSGKPVKMDKTSCCTRYLKVSIEKAESQLSVSHI